MKRRDATLEALFEQSCATLLGLMGDEIDPSVRLRAAQIVFVHLVDGTAPAVLGRAASGARVSWEQYIKAVKQDPHGNGGGGEKN